jgi:dolichol-phosphate mannosyltransferase
VIVRKGERGLSPAVIDGFRAARHPVLVCMDCDLSHPPESIPPMILALDAGQQMVIGSRYVPGGSNDHDWGLFRYINSVVATLLARPLTAVKDPMSGFFALRRADFGRARDLQPVGYKIGLELIVKCDFENVGEVPIRFRNRVHGESKLTIREQLKYIRHLRRLYIHRFGTAMHFLQFLVVGATGTVVNLAVLTALKGLGAPDEAALAGGIGVSLVSNFLLNRRFTFSYARDRDPWKQFTGFLTASAIGMAVNFVVAVWARETFLAAVPYGLQIAAVLGIAAGMVFNFVGNRYVVFRKRYIKE